VNLRKFPAFSSILKSGKIVWRNGATQCDRSKNEEQFNHVCGQRRAGSNPQVRRARLDETSLANNTRLLGRKSAVTRRNLLFLAALTPIAVAACGSLFSDDDDEDEGPLSPTATSTTANLVLLMPDASGSQTQDMAAVLEEESLTAFQTVESVSLRPTSGQTYSEAVTTLVASGIRPDLIWMDQFALPTLAEQGVTQPLTEYTRRDVDFSTDDFWPHILSSGEFRGTLHAFPLAASVCTLLYNPALFSQSNTPLPEDNWSWQDFLTLARTLNDPSATQRVWGFLQAPFIPPFFAMAWQEGSNIFQARNWDVTHAGVISALQYQADLILTHEVAPPLELAGYTTSNLTIGLTDKARNMITSGQIAMMGGLVNAEVFWRGANSVPLELVELPRGNAGATWGMVEHMVGVAQESNQPDAAYEVLDPILKASSLVLSMPAIRVSAEDLRNVHQTLTVNDSLVLLESMEESQYIDADIPEWLAFLVLASLVFPVLTGQATAQQAASDTNEAIRMQLQSVQATPTPSSS
jgi:ABC-type glycerol-3-phosphate transport system substrate-binding protein